MVICARHHWLEINDESWFPQPLRSCVQDCLTLLWTFRIPILQTVCPAELVSSTIAQILGPKNAASYTYVDFCSGAGGPTPYIEKYLNRRLLQIQTSSSGHDVENTEEMPKSPIQFLMTDLFPRVEAWEAAVKRSDNLGYVATPVDAANAPKNLLQLSGLDGTENKKLFRLFNLAFHHFDDELAQRILENSLETSDGFGIFELQCRTLTSLLTIVLMWPLLLVLTPFFFWHSPFHLFFTYLCPIIPFVVVFDGLVSSIRTRTPEEVETLLKRAARKSFGDEGLKGWKFMSGSEMHTPPIGRMSWVVCIKEEGMVAQ